MIVAKPFKQLSVNLWIYIYFCHALVITVMVEACVHVTAWVLKDGNYN